MAFARRGGRHRNNGRGKRPPLLYIVIVVGLLMLAYFTGALDPLLDMLPEPPRVNLSQSPGGGSSLGRPTYTPCSSYAMPSR